MYYLICRQTKPMKWVLFIVEKAETQTVTCLASEAKLY